MGLIQKEIESVGIRTASVMHLVDIAKKVRPPRMMHTKLPAGRAFGNSGNIDLQKSILKQLLLFSLSGEAEALEEIHLAEEK